MRAVASVRPSLPPFKLWIAGTGEQEGHLRQLAIQEGIGAEVEFLGRLAPAEMVVRMQQSDLFVSPALSDGNNISLCEAMAYAGSVREGTPFKPAPR